MNCPLIQPKIEYEDGEEMVRMGKCTQEECAWWVKPSKSCAMEAIPRIIGYVGFELSTIKDKMPHEGQFGK